MLAVMPLTENANERQIAATGEVIASGAAGDCTRKSEGSTLTISGSGYMDSYYTYRSIFHQANKKAPAKGAFLCRKLFDFIQLSEGDPSSLIVRLL